MKKPQYERRCRDCDTVNSTERNECHRCGCEVFSRYKIVEEQPTSAPVTERRDY